MLLHRYMDDTGVIAGTGGALSVRAHRPTQVSVEACKVSDTGRERRSAKAFRCARSSAARPGCRGSFDDSWLGILHAGQLRDAAPVDQVDELPGSGLAELEQRHPDG
jgi:hypothetical protein